MNQPTVSATIAQWGETGFTVRAVEALRRSRYDGDIEIFVYDNASPGGPGPVAERNDVTLVQGDVNIGFGPAHNALAARAGGEYLLILNNDTIVDPRCIARLVARANRDDHPGVVVPQYRDFDGTVLEMGGYLGSDGSGWQLFRGLVPPAALQRLSYPAHYGSAACFLVDAGAFEEHGGFDDVYAPAYYEDADLCLKLRTAGRSTVVEPAAVVFHYEGGTAGTDVTAGMKRYQVRNQTVFVERWSGFLDRLPPVSLHAALNHALTPRAGRRILWAAPFLPRPDRDAGSARILQMLETLVDAGHFVGFWAEHAHDAGRYGAFLEAMGIPWFGVEHPARPGLPQRRPALGGIEELMHLVTWDAVVASWPDLIGRLQPAVKAIRPEAVFVADPVDLHFLREGRAGELGIADIDIEARDRELALYRTADAVITASDYETEVLRESVPGIVAHTFAMSAEEAREVNEPARDGALLFLGNFHHHPNVDAVAWWVDEIAAEVERRAGHKLQLRVVGSGSDGYREAWPGDVVELAGWVEDLGREFATARVFVAPLRYGAGTKGKISAALAHGVPTVTTSIGAEGLSGAVLDALLVADDASNIAEHVVRLMHDDDAYLRQRAVCVDAATAAWARQRALSEEFADWFDRRLTPTRQGR